MRTCHCAAHSITKSLPCLALIHSRDGRNTRLCVPTDMLLIRRHQARRITEDAIPSTFSRSHSITQILLSMLSALGMPPATYDESSATHSLSRPSLGSHAYVFSFLGTTDRLLTILQSRYPYV